MWWWAYMSYYCGGEERSSWVKVLKPPASLFNSPLGYEDSCLCPGCPRMLLSNLEVSEAVNCLFMTPVPVKQGSVTVTVPVAVWSYPERTKLHTRSVQGRLVTTLSCFLGLSQVPQLDLSFLLYFKTLASEPQQEYCVLSLLEGHGFTPLLPMLTFQHTPPFPILSQPLANLPHPSRFSSNISFPYKDFPDFLKWNEQESAWRSEWKEHGLQDELGLHWNAESAAWPDTPEPQVSILPPP